MDKAKAAVSDFMSRSGKHDTTVHEKVAPAVTHETVNPHKHENITTAVDREVHQDHYHTSVQPVHHQEVLPEQHSHNLAAVEHRDFHHGRAEDVTARLKQEAAQFANKREVGSTKETSSTAPVVAGEHVHHHVHETIQPVIQKETIQPHVVHTTVPIHETHHNAAQHHTTSALPAVSMADFKHQGGVLTGRKELNDNFEGEPRAMGIATAGKTHGNRHTPRMGSADSISSASSSDAEVKHSRGHTHHPTAGVGGATAGAHSTSSAMHSGHPTGSATHTGAHSTTSGTDGGLHSTTSGTNSGLHSTNSTGTATHKKPSLLDKLNPKVDANGDGKAGFMK